MLCVVCKFETKKYKCPKCLEFYCSLICWKNHSELGCILKEPDNNLENIKEPSIQMPFKTEDTVDNQLLKQLEHSDELKHLLYNPHLRNLLKEIDEAPSAWNAMKVAMQEPLFIEFADECLKIIEPQDSISDEQYI